MNMGKRSGEIYRELTPAGVGLCVAAGAVAELVIFGVLGIRLENVPLPVLVFLWGSLGVVISGVLITADMAEERIEAVRAWAEQREYRAALEAERDLIAAMRTEMEYAVSAAMRAEMESAGSAVARTERERMVFAAVKTERERTESAMLRKNTEYTMDRKMGNGAERAAEGYESSAA